MPTIDLSTPPPPPPGLLEGLPRRVALNLRELEHLARLAGGAPLPFTPTEPSEPSGPSGFEGRLGSSPGTVDSAAYQRNLEALPSAVDSLVRRGLIVNGVADPGALGAMGLLALPDLAVDLDVVVTGSRARAWHRHRDGAVATLATADGVVFELAWCHAALWPDELGRTALLPEEFAPARSAVGGELDLPLELFEAATEAVRTGRTDLLPVLAARHQATRDGGPLDVDETIALLTALISETRGRLRALAAHVAGGGTTVGVVSWVLLADGWRELRGHRKDDQARITVRPVQSSDLARALGPMIAEVTA